MNDGVYGLTSKTAMPTMPLLGNPTGLPSIDFAPSFTPAGIAGIVAWFDASDESTFTLTGAPQDYVAEWRDKSGNGYSISQAVANNQPRRTGLVMGRPTIDFDGVNDCLYSDGTGLAAAYNGDKPSSAFIVGQMHYPDELTINTNGSWMSFGSISGTTPFLYVRSNGSTGLGQFQRRNNSFAISGAINAGLCPTGQSVAGNVMPDAFIASYSSPLQKVAALRVHSAMYSTGGGVTRPTYGVFAQSAGARVAGATTSNRFTIGAFGRNTFTDFFPGRISEVIVYSRELSDGERIKVVCYLANKYAISTPVL